VLDRASTFADEELTGILRDEFVPVALDVWYEQRRQDEVGEFYRSVVFQREGTTPERTTQGLYIFTADGELRRGWNNRGVNAVKPRVLEELRRLREEEPAVDVPALDGPVDARLDRTVPEGSAVVDVYTRILDADWPATEDTLDRTFQRAVGRDHLWILRDEIDALARGTVPSTLARRLARFHLVDGTRGEPPMWWRDHLEVCSISLVEENGASRLRGRVVARTGDDTRAGSFDLFGVIEIEDGVLARFDVVALGTFRGEGRWTGGAPPGEFTLGVAFRLSDPDDVAARVPPQAARDLDEYLSAP